MQRNAIVPPTAGLMGRKARYLFVVLAAGSIALVGIGYYAIVVHPQPNITMTNTLEHLSGCGVFGGSYYTYEWTFTLTNAGSASGFALVTIYLDGNVNGQAPFYVAHGSTADAEFSENAPDCNAHTSGVAITGMYKA